MDSSLFEQQLVPQQQFYPINTNRASNHHHLFHQTQSLLWNTLLKQFRTMLSRLIDLGSKSSKESSSEVNEKNSGISGQVLIDELDRMVKNIEDQMTQQQQQSFWSNQVNTSANNRIYSDMTLCYGRIYDDILQWLAVEQNLVSAELEFEDEFVDTDNEFDDEVSGL